MVERRLDMLLRFARSLRDPWVLGQLALFALVGGGVQLAGDRLAGPPAPGSRPAALTLMILATLLILAASQGLGRSLTPTVVPVVDGQLVTHGLYAWLRHPIYLAVILMLTGMALLSGRWWAGLLVAPLAYAYFDRKAAVEERLLEARYPEYAAYRARVGKLLPRLSPASPEAGRSCHPGRRRSR
ncbi:MAG: isoprenylcysteine carboxylmethyltransferase family protein [Caldilineae bacterium]|nr:isoprenylcysteine carboxylmethyltransferase family protein [Chloroflexota bacterium]MCB9177157.1 isoprenylcysteine carboxylmethyltransferase family protein [Caldilineae bacterium]